MNSGRIKPPVAPLFVPGNRPERFAKAMRSDADAIIIDLEDAVRIDEKAAAQKDLRNHGIIGKPVFVRINARSAACWCGDIAALAEAAVDAIMLPKAETPEDVEALHTALGRELPVIVLVESAAGFSDLQSLLRAPSVLCAAFGALDYALDVGCQPEWEALLYARAKLVLECRIAGLPAPLDGVTPQYKDDQLLESDSARARSLGYGGKLAIHPRQAAIIRQEMMPSATEIDWARNILSAAQDTPGAAQFKGTMIDLPVIRRAKRILDSKQT